VYVGAYLDSTYKSKEVENNILAFHLKPKKLREISLRMFHNEVEVHVHRRHSELSCAHIAIKETSVQ